MPICCMCREVKPPEAFAFRSIATGELQSHCRECHAAYRRQHYLDNRPIYIAREVARINGYRIANRPLIFAYLASHPCVDCGESDVLVLDFDHREPAQKRSEVSQLAARKPWHIVLAEIAKCDVRCANCHRRRTASQFNWPQRRRDLNALPVPLVELARTAAPCEMVPEGTQRCSRCGTTKSLDQYSIKNKKTGRRATICKPCIAVASRAHYARNKEAYLANGRKNKKRYRKQNQIRVREFLAGQSCVDCGESDPTVLEFDHRDGVKKEDVVARLVGSGQWSRVAAEIAKCDIRCANCHRRRTAEQFGWIKRELQLAASAGLESV